MWKITKFDRLQTSWQVFDFPYSIQVTNLVRVSCENGHDFIRRAASRVHDNPFPPHTDSRPSRTEGKERKRLQKQVVEGKSIVLPAITELVLFRKAISHFVMNLPDSAITFLNAFRGMLSDESRDLSRVYEQMPMVHCHCFTREQEFEAAQKDIRQVSGVRCPLNFYLYII